MGAVIAFSGAAKIAEPYATIYVLRMVWGMPYELARLTFALLIVGQVAVALLLVKPFPFARAIAIAFLLAVSTSPALQLARGAVAPCGCGLDMVVPESLAPYAALIRNALLVAICFVATIPTGETASTFHRKEQL